MLPHPFSQKCSPRTSKIFRKIQKKHHQNTETLINRMLEWAYERAVNGLGFMRSVEVLAQDHLARHNQDEQKAANALLFRQGSKAALNGFCMNFGGIVALPVTLPLGILIGLYIQLRMITVMAVIGGYDVHDPRVKTLCYVCLAGNNAKKIFQSAGLKAGGKFTASMMSHYMTGDVIKILHKALGAQAIAHFSPVGLAGSAGAVSFGRFLPVAGGFISAGWTSFMTRQIGKVAREIFVELPLEHKQQEEISISQN
ncbi:EcsC family protein [Acetobacteraceae bacterium]|nr:EcsC family protein [Acetobacteraceae bacterium]